MPAFLLALEPSQAQARAGFVRRIATTCVGSRLPSALPAGIVTAAATFAAYADARIDGASLRQARTTATVVLFVVAMGILAHVALPWNVRRAAMLLGAGALFVAAVTVPSSAGHFDIAAPSSSTWATSGVLVLAAGAALALSRRVTTPLGHTVGLASRKATLASADRVSVLDGAS